MTDNKPILEENKTKPIDKADLSLWIEAIFQVAYKRANLNLDENRKDFAIGYIEAIDFIAGRMAGLLYSYGIELEATGKLAMKTHDNLDHFLNYLETKN